MIYENWICCFALLSISSFTSSSCGPICALVGRWMLNEFWWMRSNAVHALTKPHTTTVCPISLWCIIVLNTLAFSISTSAVFSFQINYKNIIERITSTEWTMKCRISSEKRKKWRVKLTTPKIQHQLVTGDPTVNRKKSFSTMQTGKCK